MNFGPLIFLAAFFALSASWFGFVLGPQVQVGRQSQTNVVNSAQLYPSGPPGLARQGEVVYRANGCAACHSQQIDQTATVCDVVLVEVGTNQMALVQALHGFPEVEPRELFASLPAAVLKHVSKGAAEAAMKRLAPSGAQVELHVVPTGPDIARGWGRRRTVARDYLFDSPVMLGSQRVGPDLANVGHRLPDVNWHLRHLYAPRSEVKESVMPPYPFLFVKQKVGREPSPHALQLQGGFAPPAGYEIVPTSDAIALAVYLANRGADLPIYEAPFSVPTQTTNAPPVGASTNAPASSSK